MKRKGFTIFVYLLLVALFLFSSNISTVNCVIAGEMRIVPKDAEFVAFYTNPLNTPGYTDYVVSFNSDGSMSFDFSRGTDGINYGFQPNSWYKWEALFYMENLEKKPLNYKIINQGMDYITVEDGITGASLILNGENQDDWVTINGQENTYITVVFTIPADPQLGNISGTLSIIFDRDITPNNNDNGGGGNSGGNGDAGGTDETRSPGDPEDFKEPDNPEDIIVEIDSEVPVGGMPVDPQDDFNIQIIDEKVPAGGIDVDLVSELPETGEVRKVGYYGIGISLIIMGFYLARKKA